MAVPKRRKSHSTTRMGRNHKNMKFITLTPCSHCGELKLPHVVCSSCGYYKNKLIQEKTRPLN